MRREGGRNKHHSVLTAPPSNGLERERCIVRLFFSQRNTTQWRQARGPFHFLNITMSFSSSEWVQSAVCAGAGALAMYLLMKSDSEKDEVVAAPVKKQTDSISVVRTTTSIPRTFLPLPSSPRAEGAASLHLALRFLGSFKF